MGKEDRSSCKGARQEQKLGRGRVKRCPLESFALLYARRKNKKRGLLAFQPLAGARLKDLVALASGQ